MYIRNLDVQAFRVFTSASVKFCPGINAVVGYNGTGKSNLYSAILFALLDATFGSGSGTDGSVLQMGIAPDPASVQITFALAETDSLYSQFPEGILKVRRTFDSVHDSYAINDTQATRIEVLNLLAALGVVGEDKGYDFIIQQSTIYQLEDQPEVARLQALRATAGLLDYQSKRSDALKQLDVASGKLRETEACIDQLGEKLDELGRQLVDLQEYQDIKRDQRAAEHLMWQRSSQAAQEELAVLEQKKSELLKKLDELNARRRAIEAQNEADIPDVTVVQRIAELTAASENLKRVWHNFGICKTTVDTHAAMVQSFLQNTQQSQRTIMQDLEAQHRQAQEAEEMLAQHCNTLTSELDATEAAIQELSMIVADVGTASGTSLGKLISDSHATSESLLQHTREIEDCITRELATIQTETKALEDVQGQIESLRQSDLFVRYESIQHALQNMHDAQRGAEVTLADAERHLLDSQASLNIAQSELIGLIPGSLATATKACLDLVNRLGLQGVHGLVIEAIEAPPMLYTALEVALGTTAAFTVIVDTAQVAQDIISRLRKVEGLSGRLNFAILEDIHVDEPPILDDVCRPFIGEVRCDPHVRPAILHALGHAYITPSLEDAHRIAAAHKIDCYTIEGDVVLASGVTSGGFRLCKQFKYAAELRRARKLTTKVIERRSAAMAELLATKERLTATTADWKSIEEAYRVSSAELARLEEERTRKHRICDELRERVEKLQAEKNSAERRRESIANNAVGLQAILTRAGGSLTPADAERARAEKLAAKERLLSELASVRQRLVEERARKAHLWRGIVQSDRPQTTTNFSATVYELEPAIARFAGSAALFTTLGKEFVEVSAQLGSLFEAMRATVKDVTTSSELHEMLTSLQTLLGETDRALRTIQSRVDEETSRYTTQEEERKKRSSAREEQLEELVREQTLLEADLPALSGTCSALVARIQGAAEEMQMLGAPEELARIRDAYPTREALARFVRECASRLNGRPQINQLAADQHEHLTEKKNNLERRLAEVADGEDAISGMITELDERHQKHFRERFELVNRRFQTVFRTLTDATSTLELEELNGEPVGIKIVTDFFENPQKLSGGQTSLLNISFALALQEASPMKLLILDEVDSMLDGNYRQRFARLLLECAQAGMQVLVTSFRTEIIEQSDAWFAVQAGVQGSIVVPTTREEALIVATNAH
ncbi:SMC3-like protein [Giardia muris]|uniref:SMC3-like protein n=1 Tax=Giardia muris TaxID=5742 RepID=A0A4Z1SND7_GIAMU|nr:SMC3-like protein [Giardia muris]|eukprot:TNJ26375.1 SMC3-like protein [Giardia muris]